MAKQGQEPAQGLEDLTAAAKDACKRYRKRAAAISTCESPVTGHGIIWGRQSGEPQSELTVGTVVLVDEIRKRWRQLATDKTDPAHDLARDVF
jgi:hypothetical protein